MPTLPPTAEAYPQSSPDESPFFAAARLAAEGFILPEGWQEGRNYLNGLAVDAAPSLDKDDVVGFTGIEGEGTLRVSISDTGTFLLPITPVRVVAEKRKWSKYDIHGRPTRPMIEPAISEDKMSLLHRVERPVATAHIPVDDTGAAGKTTISYDVMTATSLTYEQADFLLDDEDNISPTALTLRGLQQAAINLRNGRLHDGSSIGHARAQNDEGEFIEGTSAAQFIIKETMIAANAGILTHMLENNIPAMFRNNVPGGMKFAEAMANIEILETMGAVRARWAAESLGHVMLRKAVYGHWTSPLRRLADFINHANLAAHHAGREYPYPQKFINTLAERMNFLREREGALSRTRRQFVPARLIMTSAVELGEAIEQGEPTPLQLATALFGARGSTEAVVAARRIAALHLTFNATQSNAVLQVAVSKNYLTVRKPRPGEDAGGSPFVAELQGGGIYPYAPGSKQRTFDANTRLLGAIAGLTPEEAAPKAANIKVPADYMEWLKRERYIGYRCIVDRTGPSQFTVTGILRIGGQKYIETLTATTQNSAQNVMAELFIDRFNLAIELPEKLPPKPQPAAKKDIPPTQPNKSKLEPAQQLIRYQQATGSEKPVYTYLGFDTEQGGHMYKIEFVDENGVRRKETGNSRTRQQAKQNAANRLLGQLPQLPSKGERRRQREKAAEATDEEATEPS